MKNTSLILLFLFFIQSISIAQNGKISGKVIDSKTGETLPGASILLEGTTMGAASDFDGNYMISSVPEGTYTIICKYVSYADKKIQSISVKSAEVTTVNFTLEEPKGDTLMEVVIAASLERENTNTLFIMQKNNASVSDGVSAETIKKTPDRNTSDVLKRVSGASIQENKFAIIRGLNDRYNAAYINGAPLPSSESDRKAFSFDIFPANLLDNLIILKSATPELPADFAGGVIQINTKSIPDNNQQQLSISGGYNTITTFKESKTYNGGKFDWLGLDDGTRELNSAIPGTEIFKKYTIHQQAELAKNLKNDWAITNSRMLPNLALQYSIARNFEIKNKSLGMLFAITYNNNNSINESIRREFQELSQGEKRPIQEFELKDQQYSNTILTGILGNFAFKINDNNQFSFKNIYSINTEDRVITRDGIRDFYTSPKTLEYSSVRWFTQNNLYSGQLSGDHYLPTQKIKIKWIAGYSDIVRNIPNMRRMVYTKLSEKNDPADPDEPDPIWAASVPTSQTSATSAGNLFFSTNNEKIYSGNLDMTYSFDFKSIELKNNFKLGGGYQLRDRVFNARQFGITRYSVVGGAINFQTNLLFLPEETIFDPENMGLLQPGKGGFKIEETTKKNDSYSAFSNLANGFIMLDNKWRDKVRLVWGLRLESFQQNLSSFEDDGKEISLTTEKLDFLPSANLIYSINAKQNIRVSYSQTVCRPEFRELAPFGFFDFSTFFTVRGNPVLRRTLIQNFDLRYEVYPGRGQVFSVSVFKKDFTDPIEQVNRAESSRELYYRNAIGATNYGAELEMRVVVGALLKADSSTFLNNLTLFANYAYIRSQVDVSGILGSISDSRPLQGQSPYIVNGGIQYLNTESGFSTSLSLNRIGRRIAIVGNTQEPDIWEEGRTIIDLQIAKSFLKQKLEFKLNLRDGLSQKLYFYQDLNKNNKLDLNEDNIMAETNFGPTFSLGVSFKF